MGELKFTADRECLLKDFLVSGRGVSKRLLSKLRRTENGITRNGVLIRTVDRVFPGDVIILKTEDAKFLEPSCGLEVPVVFENESLAVFDKPVGMPVHPSIKHQGDTLGNFFALKYPGLTFRPVNRLDKDTSGLCLTAKNAYSASRLQNSVKKVYYAVAQGEIKGSGTIDLPIARECDSIIKRTVREDGQRAVTHYRAVESGGRFTLLEITLETGRTHQIRVHFSHIGHPLAGDDMYGGDTSAINNQALHCGKLSFKDPVSGMNIKVESPIREDMKNLLK
ncbi:MAG: RluA family pseudouridine synthase [Porcipelethomonas sp.]